MEVHVNGWPTIERQLHRLEKRQGEIARLLGMTPAAVSQVKKGSFLLNPKQLEKIALFLQFDEEVRSEFYSELFNARLVCREAPVPVSGRERGHYRVCLNTRGALRRRRCNEIPLADIGLLAGYEATLESLSEYLLRNTPERKSDTSFGIDVCALRFGSCDSGIGLPPGSLIVIESGRYPEPGSLNFVVLRDGRCLLREYHPEDDRIRLTAILKDAGDDLVWKRGGASGPVDWLHPVLEMTIRPVMPGVERVSL